MTMTVETAEVYQDTEDPSFREFQQGTEKYLQEQFDNAGILARVVWTPHACAAHFADRRSMTHGSQAMPSLVGVHPRHIHRFAESGTETFVITFDFRAAYIKVGK